jgi:heat shock protein HslJ
MRYSLFLLLLATAACQSPQVVQTNLAPGTAASVRVVPDAPLRNTRWVPREIAGRPITTAENTPEPYLLLRLEGMAEGNAGCNRFRGEATEAGTGQLRFGALLSTRMACPAMATETAFSNALTQTRRYRISGDTLRFYDDGNALLTQLEAVYLK